MECESEFLPSNTISKDDVPSANSFSQQRRRHAIRIIHKSHMNEEGVSYRYTTCGELVRWSKANILRNVILSCDGVDGALG